MLTIFFTIIFIAELIITIWVVTYIRKLDMKVTQINQNVIDFQPVLKDSVCKFKIAVNTVLFGVDYFAEFVAEKKEQCVNALSHNLIVMVLFLILNTGGKRILALIDLFMAFNKFIKTR